MALVASLQPQVVDYRSPCSALRGADRLGAPSPPHPASGAVRFAKPHFTASFFFLRLVPGIARIVKCIYPDTFSVLNRLTAWNKSAAWWIQRIRSCYGTLSTCCCSLGYFVLLKVRSLHEEAILRMEAETRQKHQVLIERQNFQGSQAKSHNPRETLEPPRSSADIQIFMGHVRRIRPPSPFPYSSSFYFWWLLIFDDNLL